ncbi:hydrolase [Asanoa ishikariensis]|uniref:Alpha/beta hydrolase fold n=1 Tax=Asanoa ishikariensis TaxID=137265 RepID=A0A1H3T7F7_9ACTN|nr:alpha/beta hydrolase [Asanoa ishikariensis]GIF62931.1 hydrolase [Asanoa ishikariensis]SDZ45867.1 alpha/beta hydrolase fold [Asanoa ishikariensis]
MTNNRLTRRAVSAVLVASLTAVAGGARHAAASDGPPPSAPTIEWTSCEGLGDQFQCARVPVPLDWDEPDGEQIELAVMKHLASKPDERIGTMFIDPGGPGQSGVGLVGDSGEELDAWGDGRFDLVGWDPRGTNDSSPVRCFTSAEEEAAFWDGVSIPSTPEESAAYQRKTVELAKRCGEVSGDLLSHITTADTARDLDRLRAGVGEERITYVGLSYGSLIGQTYLNLFPGRVRAIVMDGIVDAVDATTSMETNIGNTVSSADEVFRQFLDLCQNGAPGECALAGHDEPVQQRVARLFTQARLTPIPAPNADPPGELTYGDLQVATFNPLRVPPDWPQFAEDLDAAVEGDASALLTAARAMQTPAGFTAATTSAAISCGDAPARVPSSDWPTQIARFTEAGELWGPVNGWWLWAPCASGWPADATDRYTGPWNAQTENPVLLLSARYDPGTPYRNAVATEKRLANAVLVTLEGWGHPSYQIASACIDEVRTRYLVDLTVPARGTTCQPDEVPFS